MSETVPNIWTVACMFAESNDGTDNIGPTEAVYSSLAVARRYAKARSRDADVRAAFVTGHVLNDPGHRAPAGTFIGPLRGVQ